MRTHRIRLAPFLTILAAAFLLFEGTASAAKAKKPLVDLNTASQKELEELPGIGEATAKKIIAGRPYSSVADLAKAGVPEKTISKIQKQVTVSGGGSAAASAASSASKSSSSSPPAKSATAGAMRSAEKPASTAEKSASTAMAGGKIDLNTASEKDLESLPGVGPAYASKIVAARPYSSVADLSRSGIPASTIDKISPLVTASRASSRSKPASASTAPDVPASRAPAGAVAKETGRASAPTSAEGPPQKPPVRGMVWVNTETKVFHREGDHWYGNTKHGQFMTEADAVKAGYRESKQKISGQ